MQSVASFFKRIFYFQNMEFFIWYSGKTFQSVHCSCYKIQAVNVYAVSK